MVLVLASVIHGTAAAAAVETPGPTSSPSSSPQETSLVEGATDSEGDNADAEPEDLDPTLNPKAELPPEEQAPQSNSARSVPVGTIPLLDITLLSGRTLAELNASKAKIPADPAKEAHPTLTLTDVVDPTNNLVGVSLEEIKGRGNFTWLLDKKPYQIKFDTSTSVLGLPKAKTWILLANHADPSLLRNKVALDLAAQLGIPGTPDVRAVDLTINGEYLGNYLLTEKVEVKKNRLELGNPGGLLLELDNSYGKSEEFFFTTKTSGTTFVLKDAVQSVSTPLPTELAASYQSAQQDIDAFESALYSPNPDWTTISSLIDVDSFLAYYFVLEFSENPDAVTSSVYFWRDGPDDVLHAGPAWDFDIALGLYASAAMGGDPTADYQMNARTLRTGGTAWFQELFRNPEFAKRAGEIFDERVRPAIDTVLSRLDADVSSLGPSAEANFSRWTGVLGRSSIITGARPVGATWQKEAAFLRAWIAQRVEYLGSRYSSGTPVLTYSAHSAQIGWQPDVTAGQFVGTTGRGLQLEALSVELAGGALAGQIQSRGHVQNIGWMPWAAGDTMVGTTGRGLRLEAVSFALSARVAADYDLSYRAHVQNIGWMPWVGSGAVAGTTGQGLQVEAVQIRLLRKAVPVVGSTVAYSTHVSQIGWTIPVVDGAVSGAVGAGLQVESLRASLTSSEYDGTMSLRAHVQDIGWTDWGDSPGPAGTEGRGLRLEAVQLRLQGEISQHYRVRYSAYVDGAWRDWVTGGQTAGTTGQAKRVEALRIELVPRS
ncbi:CotH kinase family protein [Microbacterium sp. NPDC016588]